MDTRFPQEVIMQNRKHTKMVHEGRYVAEVDIEIIDSDEGWEPYLSLNDALKIDTVRDSLRQGTIAEAQQYSKVYELA